MPIPYPPLPRGRRRPPVVDGGPARRTLPVWLAARIDQARRQAGLSIRGLARAAGISTGMAHYLTTGARLPSRQVAERIIDVLDLDEEVEEALLEVAAVRGWDRDLDPGEDDE
jgi:transcriptional regulator with XRE-family HTH domain